MSLVPAWAWRLRVVAVVVPAAVVLFVAIALAPDPDDVPTAPPVKAAAETQCLPFKPITSVKQLNTYVDSVRGGPEFQGADVGADVKLTDGRLLWVFGDTLRSPTFQGQRFVRNSMLVFTTTCAQVVLPADHGALIPDRPDGVGYWPMSIAKVARKGYDLVGVGVQRVKSTGGTTSTSFSNLGPAFAVFIVRPGATPQLLGVTDIGADRSGTKRPTWGAASAVHGGYVYLYGTANPEKKGVFGFSLQVARVKPDDLLRPSTWRYWDGKHWVAKASSAKVLIPAVGGVSQTLSVFERSGTWYAVSKRDEFVGTDLVIWTAPSPTGPFTASPTVAKIPSDAKTGELRYMPLAHPDLLPEKGSIIVSYSQNNTSASKVAKDPFLYRPRFLRVTLPTP